METTADDKIHIEVKNKANQVMSCYYSPRTLGTPHMALPDDALRGSPSSDLCTQYSLSFLHSFTDTDIYL